MKPESNRVTVAQVAAELGIPANKCDGAVCYYDDLQERKEARNMAKWDKEKFMKTEVGTSMVECVTAWDKALDERRKHEYLTEGYRREEKVAEWCQAQWEVYQKVLLQFFEMDYHFSRTNEFFGICTEDGTDWLIKVEKINKRSGSEGTEGGSSVG